MSLEEIGQREPKMKPESASRSSFSTLERALTAARRRVFRRVLRHSAVRTLALVVAALALAVIAVMIWPASVVGPLAVLGMVAVAVFALVTRFAIPLLRVPDVAQYARRLDESYASAGEKNEFLSALELGRAPARTGTSPELIEALVAERIAAIERLDLDAPGRTPLRRRWLALVGAGVAVLGLSLLVSPGRFSRAMAEIAHPRWPGAATTAIEVLTGNLRVDQGADVTIEARVRGGHARPMLHARRGAGVWRDYGGEESEESLYRFTIPAVEAETRYRVAAGGATSPEYLIRVREPLRAVRFLLEYRYPDYTGLTPETLQATDGAVSGLPGTEVHVTFETNVPVRSGVAAVAGGTMASVDMIEATRGRVVIPIRGETTYTLDLERGRDEGESDPASESLGPYAITPTPDREPLVALLEPGEDSDVPADLRVPLVIHAADDYGLSTLTLHYSYEGGGPAKTLLRRFTGYPREATESHVWDLSGLNLVPGDVVRYYVQVFDNDTISGPKSARSRVFSLRIPTLAELYAEVGEEHEQAETSLKDVREEGVDLKQELERIARELTKFPVADWEDKQEIAQAFERQAEIRQELEQLAQDLGEALSRLENQNLVDDEVLAKVSEIQRLMDQVADQELREAFQRLQEQMAQMDPNEVQRALKDLTLTHEELMRNLERTIEMLKQVQLEEKLEHAAQKAEEMAEKQDQINQDLGDLAAEKRDPPGEPEEGRQPDAGRQDDEKQAGSKDEGDRQASEGEPDASDQEQADSAGGEDELSRLRDELNDIAQDEQENLEDAAELEKLLEELAQELEQMDQQMAQEMAEMSKDAGQQSSMQKNMQSAMQQMGGGKPKDAKKSGQQASRDLRSLLERMRMQQQMMMNQQMAETAEKLREAARELLKVSTSEEDLIVERDPDHRQVASDQQRLLEATRRINDLIEEIARTSIMVGTEFAGLLGQPIRSMENAVASYSRGSVTSGRTHATQALAQVNDAILELLSTEESMCQGGGGSCNSMKNSMQQMMGLSQQQQQVNEGTRQLMQQGGSRLSEGSQARMARLAAQQAAIQKGLEEVAQSLDSRRDVLGRLGDLSEEMEDVAQDLERGEIDDRLLSKQNQIMSRLLDAQRSVRKRDLGRERLSKTGEEMPRPDVLPAVPEDLLSRRERLEADILRGRSDPYPPGFRDLVERYYRALIEAKAETDAGPGEQLN